MAATWPLQVGELLVLLLNPDGRDTLRRGLLRMREQAAEERAEHELQERMKAWTGPAFGSLSPSSSAGGVGASASSVMLSEEERHKKPAP